NFPPDVKGLQVTIGRRVKIIEAEVNFAEIVQRYGAQRDRPHRLEQGRRPPEVPQRVLPGPVDPVMPLSKGDGGLGLAARVTELLPDRQRALQVREGLGVVQAGQRVTEREKRPGLAK